MIPLVLAGIYQEAHLGMFSSDKYSWLFLAMLLTAGRSHDQTLSLHAGILVVVSITGAVYPDASWQIVRRETVVQYHNSTKILCNIQTSRWL